MRVTSTACFFFCVFCLRVLLFLQHAGQLMYVPEHWFHAVVNVDDVVAVSMQNVTKHSKELQLVQVREDSS